MERASSCDPHRLYLLVANALKQHKVAEAFRHSAPKVAEEAMDCFSPW
jgi:hypothetical protein